LGAEKMLFSPMLVEGTNKRIYNIDSSIGLLVGGKIPDGRNIMNRARSESEFYKKNYAIPMSGNVLAS
jgi:20S proteasome subunit alpha 7